MGMDMKKVYSEAEMADYEEEYGHFDIGNYSPMVESFGDVLYQADIGDYEGDSLIVLKDKDGRYGYLSFGWGSCSGCDALQGCDSWAEVNRLAESFYESIIWYDSAKGLIEWIKNHDWKGDYTYYLGEENVEKATAEMVAVLEKEIGEEKPDGK